MSHSRKWLLLFINILLVNGSTSTSEQTPEQNARVGIDLLQLKNLRLYIVNGLMKLKPLLSADQLKTIPVWNNTGIFNAAVFSLQVTFAQNGFYVQ